MDAQRESSGFDLADHSAGGYGLNGEQNANGIDLSLLRENLRLSPSERIEKHYRAWLRINEVRNAGIARRLQNPASLA